MEPLVKSIVIEDLVKEYPESVRFLLDKGIHALSCGEPLWGTLESLARDNGLNDTEIDNVMIELNRYVKGTADYEGNN